MRIKDYPGTLTRQIELIAERCELTIPAPEREYQFAQHLGRKFRADLCWRDHMLIVECDGGVWTRGRHQRPMGFMADQVKQNLAVSLGYRYMRYSPPAIKNFTAAEEVASVIVGREVKLFEEPRT